ncbi:hypothetical protein F4802DRAFT_569701 [Xylaria palmicola]|nr:hypothetical protein F4802DRAFT_569701 [Xylaria palmicola]
MALTSFVSAGRILFFCRRAAGVVLVVVSSDAWMKCLGVSCAVFRCCCLISAKILASSTETVRLYAALNYFYVCIIVKKSFLHMDIPLLDAARHTNSLPTFP